MKILFLILNLGSGGAERSACAVANYMAKNGIDTAIMTIEGNDCFYPLSEKVHVKHLELPVLPKGISLKRVFQSLNRAFLLRKAIQKCEPDAVIGMSHIMSAYAVFSTVFSKIKSIGSERNNPYRYQATMVMSFIRKNSARLCDGFIHQTKRAMNFYPKSTHKKSVIIQNAVFNPLIRDISVSKERNKTITAVGRLVEDKGFDVLIEAFSLIFNKITDFKLIIFGEGSERENLQSLIDSKNMSSHIVLAGNKKDAVISVAESSLFVLSSRNEGMPNVLIEAMAVGTPSISTTCQMGPEELITDGKNGLLVPVDNPQALANAMLKVLKDETLAKSLSVQALKIRETHSIDNICTQWVDYCKKVISK